MIEACQCKPDHTEGQCLKWSARGGVAQLVMGDRATGGYKGVAWRWDILEFCPLK